jgi:hypothetical protein
MRESLYVFGFEAPAEAKSNAAHGTDFESSACVRIAAESEEEALRWGREVAERFVKELFGDPGISWKALGFAHWIETDPDEALRSAAERCPALKVGEYPSPQDLLPSREPGARGR